MKKMLIRSLRLRLFLTFPRISQSLGLYSQILKSQSNLVRVIQVTKVKPPQTNDLKPTTQGDDGQSPTDTEIIGRPKCS